MLNKNKSPGCGLISSNVVNKLTRKSIIFLTLIFNSILRRDHFPSQWKCAKIVIIPKPNKPDNMLSTYRPIRRLAIFSKIFLQRLLPLLTDKILFQIISSGFVINMEPPNNVIEL